MFRPQDMRLFVAPPDESLLAVPANVAAKSNLGWTVKYTLRFDDDVVSQGWRDRSEWRLRRTEGRGLARPL
jgi:hypothetical protein